MLKKLQTLFVADVMLKILIEHYIAQLLADLMLKSKLLQYWQTDPVRKRLYYGYMPCHND